MFGGWPTAGRCGARAASAVALAASCALAAAAQASPGSLTSAAELASIKALADASIEPYAADRERLLVDARRDWPWGSVSGEYTTTGTSSSKKCHPVADATGADYLAEGAPDAYAQALGAHLAGDDALAQQARAHVLDLVDTFGFHGQTGDYSGGNQCVLELAVSVPVWVETARLLADTSVWSDADTAAFRTWLASRVYPLVAWASRTRRNNWGAAGSLAAYTIATYVDGGVAKLVESAPAQLALSPGQAAAAHADMQLRRIGSAWAGDAQCARFGIQDYGGIPEELRRGSTGCDGTSLAQRDSSLSYQTMHAELLVFHAEAMRRQGSLALYQAKVSAGADAILQSILFVIDNPAGGASWPWHEARWGTLITAATFYDHASLAAAAQLDATFRGGRALPYTRLTHRPFAQSSPDPAEEIGVPGKPELVSAR